MSGLAAFAPLFAQERLGDSLDIWMKLLIAVGTIVVSIALGSWMGRVARMPNHGWRFSVVWFAILASAVIVGLGWPPKLGVDLSGGVILVYEVDPGKKRSGETIEMGELVSSISRRINPGGQKEVVVRPFGVEQVEIIIPKVDSQTLDEIKKTISSSGLLEFRILANHPDHERIIQRALAPGNAHLKELVEGTGDSARVVARWVKIDEQEFVNENRDVTLRGKPGSREALVYVDPFNVTGEYLAKTSAGIDSRTGRPAVDFIFNDAGTSRFSQLTNKFAPDPNTGFERILAIVLDDVIRTAPNLHQRISGQGQISGSRFDEREVNAIVGVLNAGKLPAALRKEPISEQLIGPQLGADTIRSASIAMLLSAVLVPLFMIVYYRFSGVVATYAMFLNVMLVVAFMIMIKAPFTLSGLAGLALTLGMAVDANVLIYERMREEKARGAALRMVIRNGFDRALTTIIDAHITTLIAATVLYWIGTDQVKGFAVTLWLGVLINIFTATFCTRVVFDLAEKLRWLKELKMMQLFKTMHYDFLGRRHLWFTFSAIQIGIGLVAVYFRVQHGNLLDIDFSGGTEVEVLLREPEPNISVIRNTASKVLPDVSVSPVRITGEPEGKRYRVDTSETQLSKVKDQLKQVFQDKLATLKLTYDEIAAIPKDAPARPPTEQPARETPPAGQTPATKPEPTQGGSAPLPRSHELALATDVPAEFAASYLIAQATQAPADTAPATTPSATQPSTTRPNATQPTTTTAPRANPGGLPAFPSQPGGNSADAAPAGDPFAGGTQARLKLDERIEHAAVKGQIETAFESLKDQIPKVSFELTNAQGDTAASTDWILKAVLSPPQVEKLLQTVQSQLLNSPAFPSSNSFGPLVAGRTTQNAIYALVTSWVLMILYIWFRFQNVAYGLAAVVSLVHDVLVALGAVALSWYVADYLGFLLIQPFKINLGSIAAFLTIIGYSVNDTIVTFDRVREVKGKSPHITEEILNLSVNQTFARTILTTFTVFLVVLILYVAGGQELHGFAFTLLIGIICGAYSTIYVAAPLLLWFSGGHKLGRGASPARTIAAQPTAST